VSCPAGGGLRGDVAVGGHAEADGGVPAGDQHVDLGELGVGGGEADLEPFGLAEPALLFGFGDPGGQVVVDGGQPGPLGGIDAQERAPDAPLTELTLMFGHVTGRFQCLVASLPA
jgi:hypothetical protein